MVDQGASRGNRILDALPASAWERLAPELREVACPRGEVLQPANEQIVQCYFPTSGIASLLVSEASGKAVDTAIVGNEGFVGLPIFLGTDRMPVEAVVQLDLEAQAIRADALRDVMNDEPALSNLLQRYTQMVLVELSRLVLCNRVHSIEERLSRWLLQLHERLHADRPLQLTQEFIAGMIGSERPSVTTVLQSMKERGLVDTARNRIEIRDAAGLRARTCDCYATIREELDRLQAEPTMHEVADS